MKATELKYLKEELTSIKWKKQSALGMGNFTSEEKDKLYEEGRYSVQRKLYGGYEIVWEGEAEQIEKVKAAKQSLETEYKKILNRAVFSENADILKILEEYEKS